MAEFLRSRSSTTSSLALQESGYKKLCVFVNKGVNLMKGDTFGLSDPYVRVTMIGGEHSGASSKKTSVVKKTLDPVWAEELFFWVKGDRFSIMVDVFDENKLIKDDFLGRQIIHFDFHSDTRRPHVVPSLTGTIAELGTSVSLKLKDKYSGELLDGQYRPYLEDLRSQFFLKRLSRQRPQVSERGRLLLSYVFVDISEDFEHVQMPGQSEATPTGAGGGVATEQEDERAVELPPGWEERTDTNGRQFYINHISRATSFQRPGGGASAPEATPTAPPRQQRAFMERHTSVDVIQEGEGEEEEEEEEETSEVPPQPNEGANLHHLDSMTLTTHPHPPSPSPFSHMALAHPSAPQQQPSAPPGNTATPSAPTLQVASPQNSLLTIPTPQAPPPQTTPPQATPTPIPVPAATQPRPNLGAAAARVPVGVSPHHSLAIQRAAQGLPQGWQAGMTPDGRIYYINHIDRTTTWEKPRLQERQIWPSATAPRAAAQPTPQDSSLPEGWEQRVTAEGRVYYVDHNTQSTSWEHPNSQKEDLGAMPPGWEVKQMADGRLFFVDHNTHSTQWEDPRLTAKNKPTARMKYSRDYKQKYTNFRLRLPKPLPGAPNFLELPVRREHIFEDSFRVVSNVSPLPNFHCRLYVKFAGESGLDYGGLAREWFFLLSHEMFSPYYGLFEYAASDDYTLQISPESGLYNEHHIDYFKFIGRMLGLAIYHQHLLDAFFIRPFYKMILDKPVTLDDMQSVDEELYNSVQYILNNDPEPLCLTFSANKTVFGEVIEEELKTGGADIAVTETNKREYISLLIKWRFTDRVQKQMDAIKQGISDIFPLRLLKVFDPRELEYLLGGLASIDVEDWKRNTELMGYTPYDQVIVWFWKAVENYDAEMRARLLQFVTGTSKVPMNGFAELQGSNGPRKFCIKRYGSPNSLPRSHTCFNRIDLPPYGSYHKLKENLKLAVENTEGFEGVD